MSDCPVCGEPGDEPEELGDCAICGHPVEHPEAPFCDDCIEAIESMPVIELGPPVKTLYPDPRYL